MMNLAEYRDKTDRLTDYLPWALLIRPGVMLNKDGSFMRVISYRGPDLDSATRQELIVMRAKLNNALKRLGSGWCIHMEAQRYETREYPAAQFPETVTWLVDEARRETFQSAGAQYESRYYVTLTYLPPAENVGKARDLLIENKPDEDVNYRHELDQFEAITAQLTDILRSSMPDVAPLDDNELLTYLHSCVSTRSHTVAAPDIPMYLDYFITDDDLTGGLAPRLGDQYMATISFRTYPSSNTPGLLDALNQLPLAYRWSTRYIPMDKVDAQGQLASLQRKWFAKRKGIVQIAQEAITNQPATQVDPEAISKAADVEAARQELGEDLVGMGFITPTVTVFADTPEALREKVRAVQSTIDTHGFISTVEEINAVEAWIGSLPGHAYADVRRALVNTLNIASIVPVSAVWAGPTWNDHLNAPPLLHTLTRSATPFRFSNHLGDVGHTMIVGPTGAGKSIFLNLLAAQFRRYKDSQVYFFDKGRSCRCLTSCVGGQFYDLGNADELAFQPLADIDQEAERQWVHGWLIGLLRQQGVEIGPEESSELWDTLNNLAKRAPEHRHILGLRELDQNSAIKAGLEAYTVNGPYGHFFDAAATNLEYGDWQAFEMEQLMENEALTGPVLSYLFHKLEKRFTGRPTLLILDEGWVFLDNPYFADKLKDWLKTLRRRNVSVVFATQSMTDLLDSKILGHVIDSCLTRVFLPNPSAADNMDFYEKFSLNTRQVQLISGARQKREYYYQSSAGNRLFELGLSDFEVAVLGSSSKEDLSDIAAIEAQHPDDFLPAFLQHKGFDPSIVEDYHEIH